MSLSYSKYLLSPEWKAIRQEKFKADGRQCAACGSTGLLHVHHMRYPKRELTQLSDLMVLCPDCHTQVHHAIKLFGLRLKKVTPATVVSVLADYKKAGGERAFLKFKETKRQERRAKFGPTPPNPPSFRNHLKRLKSRGISRSNPHADAVKLILDIQQAMYHFFQCDYQI